MRPFGYPVTILNTVDSLGKFDGKVDEGLLVGYSVSSKAFRVFKSRTRIVKETLHINFLENKPNVVVKEPKFEGRKPQSEVYVSPSSKFEDFSDNNINEDNAAGSPVLVVRQITTNSTNTFSATVVSPTHRKSSYIDTSQLPNDVNMPELEDITYSDDEEEVGAEADFTNLETTIIISPIPTTRAHKDHPVTQIIGDLSSATQPRSMSRVA
nr:retrovirus-related Pol polyprotein from transposon TNT 1-94 [Tanacetum cinerariifolium]